MGELEPRDGSVAR